MPDAFNLAVLERLERIEGILLGADPRSDGEARAHGAGLLSYEDLQDRLTIGLKRPRRPCLRTVKDLVKRYRGIMRPVEMGHTLVGFRASSVEKLIAKLAGDSEMGGRQL